MKSKKGFSLIELLVCLSITAVILAIFYPSIKYFVNFKKNCSVEVTSLSIHKFINNSRLYCIDMDTTGYIFFNIQENYMYLYINNKTQEKLYLTNGNKLLQPNQKYIEFNKNGFTSNSCTIKYTDLEKKVHEITIGVGCDNVEIKR